MATIIHQNLFSGQEVSGSSDLYRLQPALSYLPDEEIVRSLERKGERGRDTYWGPGDVEGREERARP